MLVLNSPSENLYKNKKSWYILLYTLQKILGVDFTKMREEKYIEEASIEVCFMDLIFCFGM